MFSPDTGSDGRIARKEGGHDGCYSLARSWRSAMCSGNLIAFPVVTFTVAASAYDQLLRSPMPPSVGGFFSARSFDTSRVSGTDYSA